MLKGIDISNWQAGIDLSRIPCDFVICKATEGSGYVSPDCDRAYQQAKSLGKLLGVYHFARTGNAEKEADWFVDNVRGYVGEAILCLDYEADALSNGPAWAKRWLDRVRERTSVKPMIYMSKSVCRGQDWTDVVAADYGLWMAQYADNEPTGYQDAPWTDGKGTGAWPFFAMHQYTSKGRIGNYSGDLGLNRFDGDRDAWLAYAAAHSDRAKTIDELAREVIDGKHGNGDARRASLGGSFDAVQERVNEILGTGNVDDLARRTIAGEFGNGPDRRARLGSLYDEVQARVNALLS